MVSEGRLSKALAKKPLITKWKKGREVDGEQKKRKKKRKKASLSSLNDELCKQQAHESCVACIVEGS